MGRKEERRGEGREGDKGEGRKGKEEKETFPWFCSLSTQHISDFFPLPCPPLQCLENEHRPQLHTFLFFLVPITLICWQVRNWVIQTHLVLSPHACTQLLQSYIQLLFLFVSNISLSQYIALGAFYFHLKYGECSLHFYLPTAYTGYNKSFPT